MNVVAGDSHREHTSRAIDFRDQACERAKGIGERLKALPSLDSPLTPRRRCRAPEDSLTKDRVEDSHGESSFAV